MCASLAREGEALTRSEARRGSSRDEICWRQLTADSALVDEFDASCPAATWTAVVGLICTRSYLR